MRKAKKAYKLGRQGKMFNRYERYQADIRSKKQMAIKIAMASAAAACGMVTTAMIQMQRGLDPVVRSLRIANAVIQTAQNVQNIFTITK
jgi:hypothetical protein